MIEVSDFQTQDFIIQGAASDSLVMVLSIAGAVAFFTLILGIFIGTDREAGYTNKPPEHGLSRKRPLMAPSIAFVIALLLAVTLIPHPMTAYHGLNEVRIFSYYDDEIITYRVYDSESYQNAVDIHVLCFLSQGETLTIRIDFMQNDTLVTRVTMDLIGNSMSQSVTADQTIEMQPGIYEIEVPGSNYHSVTLSQPLVSGFFDEVLTWESYSFIMITGSFFFILLGFCVSSEEKKRYSYERIDQEPPRNGADYARRA